MILAIPLGLQILGNVLVCVESIDLDNIERKLSLFQKMELLRMYNEASFATFSDGNVIPDPRCNFPFEYWRKKEYHHERNTEKHYCKNDGGTEIWCSINKYHLEGRTYRFYCLMKGAELSEPKIWKPHPNCVPLFAYYNPKYKKYMYYQGCTNVDREKPWCAFDVRFKATRWGYCNNIEKKWTQWSSWTKCSQTCEGSKTRTRQCLQDDKPSSGCPDGNSTEQESCNPKSCPINGGWSNWSPSGVCSKNCGTGSQVNLRECNNPKPKFGGEDCGKDTVKNLPCKLAECSDDKEDLSKMLNQNGYAKILYSIFGSLGALILIAAVIAGVIYRRKKRRNIPETTTGESYNLYEESGMD